MITYRTAIYEYIRARDGVITAPEAGQYLRQIEPRIRDDATATKQAFDQLLFYEEIGIIARLEERQGPRRRIGWVRV